MNLSDPYLKTVRAKEHLDSLRSGLDEYYESKPCKFRGRDDIKNQRYRLRIDIIDPPDRLSLIAGDVFCCLRASLDHLVWALSSLNTNTYAEQTQFPILEVINDPTIESQTRGVPAGAVTLIKSLQPYQGRDRATIESHLLWRLNKLCNIDKHRRIPTHSSVVDFKLPASIPPSMVTCTSDGIMSFPLHMKDQVKLHPDVVFRVTFGDPHEGIECDRDGIEKIYDFVANDVIPRFASFFS